MTKKKNKSWGSVIELELEAGTQKINDSFTARTKLEKDPHMFGLSHFKKRSF